MTDPIFKKSLLLRTKYILLLFYSLKQIRYHDYFKYVI